MRQVVLCGESIPYRLVRAHRRSIGMEVHLEGLTVRAPRWVTIREIEAALKERAGWVVKALVEWRRRRREAMPRVWKSGAPILYRGRELALELFPARTLAMVADLFHLTVRHPAAH
jgi:predicted metal-dependent hydrolase